MQPSDGGLSAFTKVQQKRLRHAIDRVGPVLDSLPGVVIINSTIDGSALHMNAKGLERLGTSLEALQALGAGYHEKYFNLEQAREYVPRLMAMIQRNDATEAVTFFQQVRLGGYPDWQWHLTSVRPFCSDPDGRCLAVIAIAHHITAEHHYTHKVDRLLEELTFLRDNNHYFVLLGEREKEVLRLMAQGRTCGEIAEELFISTRTAETHRKNIRRKLGIHSHQELDRFARAFDLI